MCCLLFCYSSSSNDNTKTITNNAEKAEKAEKVEKPNNTIKKNKVSKNKVSKNNEDSKEERKSFRKKISFEYLKKTISEINLDSYIYKNMDKWIN